MAEEKVLEDSPKRKILVTAALPYANGPIHLGHMVEHTQTDVWVRFQKMRGHDCVFICADDAHGTPIMVSSQKAGIAPEDLIATSLKDHLEDFADFNIGFDHYSSTHTENNRQFSQEIFLKMKENGHIDVRPVKQSYCEHDKMFLPDRFVKGKCPKCGAEEQYGDSCDKCGATYSPVELKEAACVICGNPPGEKESDHIFFQLGHFQEFLKTWVAEHTQKEVKNKLQEWLENDLRDWDISRDAPYFGIEIPGFEGKYFYVWVDAPIGYISSTKEFCDKSGRDFDLYWRKEDTSELYHFIGKDIIYFHTLFWPAMLKNAEFRTPNNVFVHGFLTVNGEKMSKSKGTFVNARTYLDHLPAMYLRYYLASKLSSGLDDLDWNLEEFAQKVNSELIGKITNVASRGAQMLQKKLDGIVGELSEEGKALVVQAQEKGDLIAELYENREYNKAIVEIRSIAEMANKYFDETEPWKLIKTDPEATKKVLTTALNIFRVMAVYLKPALPDYTEKVEKLFQEEPYTWLSSKEIYENRELAKFEHLATRVEMNAVNAMIEASKVDG